MKEERKKADKLGEAGKRVGGISGGAAISTYFHGSDFFRGRSGRGGGATVSAVFTSRGNYIKSFCKGCERIEWRKTRAKRENGQRTREERNIRREAKESIPRKGWQGGGKRKRERERGRGGQRENKK